MPNNYHHYALPTTSQALKRKQLSHGHICQHSAPTSPRKLSASSISYASTSKCHSPVDHDASSSSSSNKTITSADNDSSGRQTSPLPTPPLRLTDLDYFPLPLLHPRTYAHDPPLLPAGALDPLSSLSPITSEYDIDPRSQVPRSASSFASFGGGQPNDSGSSIVLGDSATSRRNNSISATHHLAKPEWAPPDLSFKSYMSQIALLDEDSNNTNKINGSQAIPRTGIRRRWAKRSLSLSADPLRLLGKATTEPADSVSYTTTTTPTTPICESAIEANAVLEQQRNKKQKQSIYVSFPAIDDGSESELDEPGSGLAVAAATVRV
jgi:hypothetical protein